MNGPVSFRETPQAHITNLEEGKIMSEEVKEVGQKEGQENQLPKEQPKFFSLKSSKPFIEARLTFPNLMPGVKFVFKLAIQLSQEANEQRQRWLMKTAKEKSETYKQQTLDTICDLLMEHPEGFDPDEYGYSYGSCRNALEVFYTRSEGPHRDFMDNLLSAVEEYYWGALTPSTFPKDVQNSSEA